MSVVLNVIIILGIVIAGSFLLFFLGDFFLTLIDSKRSNGSKHSEVLKIEHKPEKTQQVNSVYVTDYIAEEAKEEEKKEEPKQEEVVEEEDEEEKRIAEARAALERRKAEILKRMQEQIEEEDEEEEEETDEEEVDLIAEDVKAELESGDESAVAEISEEETAEEEKVDTNALQEEIERLKNELGAEKEKYEALAQEMANKTVVEAGAVVSGDALGSKEYYEAMLEEKTNNLKVIEKEFKQCKKDFLPLHRVHNTLAKDEKKLHRREAIVAKQKVVLYGVNNYADIDEEKAKKLAEDLDLLDGLKLSVNHCKEVMEANKDRYPILERLYNTLKAQVEGLKAEIENINTILAENFNEEVAEGDAE